MRNKKECRKVSVFLPVGDILTMEVPPPPSAYVSITRSAKTAQKFARGTGVKPSPSGRVMEFEVRRGNIHKAWYSVKRESEYLAPGGTKIFDVREVDYIPW